MKKVTNESITKNSANLDQILNNVDETEKTLQSKEFQTVLVNDLINGQRNVTEWKITDGNGSVSDIDPATLKDYFDIDYSFEFKYKYKGKLYQLSLFISGLVHFNVNPVDNGNWVNAPSGGEAVVDDKNLGNGLDLALYDQDGSEISIKWLTPELEKKLTKQIIKDYV